MVNVLERVNSRGHMWLYSSVNRYGVFNCFILHTIPFKRTFLGQSCLGERVALGKKNKNERKPCSRVYRKDKLVLVLQSEPLKTVELLMYS